MKFGKGEVRLGDDAAAIGPRGFNRGVANNAA
jgi:hypothetical protein